MLLGGTSAVQLRTRKGMVGILTISPTISAHGVCRACAHTDRISRVVDTKLETPRHS